MQRPHAGEDHRRVHEGIEEAEILEEVIARHSDGERDRHHDGAERAGLDEPAAEDLGAREGLAAAFVEEVHGDIFAQSRGGVSTPASFASGEPGSGFQS